ncbi:MAG: AsnC family transcriptional regulator [Rhodospirillales bacterium]|nr:AsnC family transcriptional regulator [Rhodospirillales bacterium]
MDNFDRGLIALLRKNGRRSVADLALELGLSRATIRSRMDRLERDRDIVGYTPMLRSDAIAMPVRGLTLIEVEGRAADRVIDTLAGFTEQRDPYDEWEMGLDCEAWHPELDRTAYGPATHPHDRRHHRVGDEPVASDTANRSGEAGRPRPLR